MSASGACASCVSDSACDSVAVCLRTFAAVTDDLFVYFMRLLTKTGDLTAAIELASDETVLESDDPFMHRFQHSTIAEGILLLASDHNNKIEKQQSSTRDLSNVTAFPETLGKILGSVNLLSPDESVHDNLGLDSVGEINHATLLPYVSDILKALKGL